MIYKTSEAFLLCLRCGYTVPIKKEQGEQNEQHCPLCDALLELREVLDPPGYASERGRSLEQSQLHNSGSYNGATTQVQLVLPHSQTDVFHENLFDGRVAWSDTEHHQLLIINSGNERRGFSICRSCGASAPGDPPAWLQQSHERPFLVPGYVSAPRKCNGADGIWQGYLGHVFYSDLLLLRLQWPAGVAYQPGASWMRDALDTLTQAFLLAATRQLDVSTTELQAGWGYSIVARQNISPLHEREHVAYLFLFDTLSGGAGYAIQAGSCMEPLLEKMQQILDGCPDQCERSCYRCLRIYQNRLQHHRLDRKLAGTLLRAITSGVAPTPFSIAQQINQLRMLRQYLDLREIPYQQMASVQGATVPLLVELPHQSLAVGVYPVQQDLQKAEHPLKALPERQVKLWNDYELMHSLPQIAYALLSSC